MNALNGATIIGKVLQTLSANWTVGPNQYQNQFDSYSCGVQVNQKHTVFFFNFI